MSMNDLLLAQFQRLHGNLDKVALGLTQEQLYWCPGENSNNIAFCLWHYARSEDNNVRWNYQNRRPTVWLEEGWNDKFGLDKVKQGTGMSHQEVEAIRFPSIDELLSYMSHVWQSTDDFVRSASLADLEQLVGANPRPGATLANGLAYTVAHGSGHLGEIWTIRGLLGMGNGSPI